MPFSWRYEDGDGNDLGSSDPFPDRDAAEAWMGEAWEDLLDRRVERVVLVGEDGKPRYRMGLREG
jgi:hypothetical protein